MKAPSALVRDGVSGLHDAIAEVVAEVAALYQEDASPWVVGYSGGKDSTTVLQLVWLALRSLPPERRTKPVHVISTDTLVENPVVAAWATGSLDAMRAAARAEGLPIHPHRLTPEIADSFWVCLIGKGYPSPRPMFRWCTDRLKIRPSNKFIREVVIGSGEAILLLGTRRAESVARARRMERAAEHRVRERLVQNENLPGCLAFTPIEDWSNDDVWLFLMQVANPWGWTNKSLLTMYQGASEGGECPLVVDTTTPSCGASRFGCWTCTMVEQDKSMQAMIQNDADKDWMAPLLELRDALDVADDRHLRDYRRMNGRVTLMGVGEKMRVIPGPYLQSAREDWLRRLLAAQRWIRDHGPEDVRRIELISLEELRAIRRIWVIDKHEVEDTLPRIYAEALGEPYPEDVDFELLKVDAGSLDVLAEVCAGDRRMYETVRDLLAVERQHRHMGRRAGLPGAVEGVLKRHLYSGEEEALGALRAEHERAVADGRRGTAEQRKLAARARQGSLFGEVAAPPPEASPVALLEQATSTIERVIDASLEKLVVR